MSLGFGREVLHWWHEDSPASKKDSNSPHSLATSELQTLSFGNQAWTIRRQEFHGPAAGVAAALKAFCRAAIADAPTHGDAPDKAEQNVLKRLAAEKPLVEEAGHWRLYQWAAGFPVMIGTRVVSVDETGWRAPVFAKGVAAFTTGPRPSQAQGRATQNSPVEPGTILAETAYRVVIWSMAVPAAKDSWTLYVFQAAGAGKAATQAEAEIPLPPGAERLATIRADGSSITTFSVDGDLGGSARRFYDDWFAAHGWAASISWQQTQAGWQARFELAGQAPEAVDIRLSDDRQGRATGLLMQSEK
jgi:hypothetical protein